MARLTRKNLKVFGGEGTAANFAKFGSQAAAAPVKTMDVELIQSLDAWIHGWTEAVNASNLAPFLEDMNAAMYVMAYQTGYLLQDGVPEWSALTTYFIGSIVKKTGTVELYSSLIDDNLNDALGTKADNASWKYLGDLKNILPDGVGLEVNGTSGKLQLKDGGIPAAKIAADAVDKTKINADVAGNGLTQAAGGELQVNPDDTTIEINADALRVKAGGIGTTHIATGGVGAANIAGRAVTEAKIDAFYVGNSGVEGSVSIGSATTIIDLPLSPVTNIRILVIASTTVQAVDANNTLIYLTMDATQLDGRNVVSGCNTVFGYIDVPAGAHHIYLKGNKPAGGASAAINSKVLYFVLGTTA